MGGSKFPLILTADQILWRSVIRPVSMPDSDKEGSDSKPQSLGDIVTQYPSSVINYITDLRDEDPSELPKFVRSLSYWLNRLKSKEWARHWEIFFSTGLFSFIQELASDPRIYEKRQNEAEDSEMGVSFPSGTIGLHPTVTIN